MCGRLGVGVGAVEMIDAIKKAEGIADAVGLAVGDQRDIKRRLDGFKLFASLGGVARGKSSGEVVSDLNEVFGSHVFGHWWKTSTLPD